MTWEMYEKVLMSSLSELRRAALELAIPTEPDSPMPRPRIYRFSPSITWPYIGTDGVVRWTSAAVEGWGEAYLYDWTVEKVIMPRLRAETGAKPRRVLHIVRQIEAATAWARARRAGRERHAQQILAAQARAHDELVARAAMEALASDVFEYDELDEGGYLVSATPVKFVYDDVEDDDDEPEP